MREGLYEVELVDAGGQVAFPEASVDGKTYAQAAPGHEFSVRVTVHRNPVTDMFPFQYLRLGLFIDGHDVNYWKRMDLTATTGQKSVSASFQGWKKNTMDLRAFQFATPALASAEEDADPQFKAEMSKKPLGQIKVVVHEAVLSNGIFENKSGFHEMPSAPKVSESKKFWQQASVTTSAGRHIESEKEKFTPLPMWKNISSTPNYEMSLNYHTSEMIQFIRTFSEHQKKVQANTAAAAAAASSGGAGSKRKRKEPAAAPVVVDLTLDDDDNNNDGGDDNAGGRAPAAATARGGKKAAPAVANDEEDSIHDTESEGAEDSESEVEELDKSKMQRQVDLLDLSGDQEAGGAAAEWQKVSVSL